MSALLLLAALAAPAHAAKDNFLQIEGTECAENAIPIAGTSGFSNARHALRTTTQTYSAANYAEKHLFPHRPKDGKGGAGSFEFFQMIKAVEVPAFEPSAGSADFDGAATNCPAEYRVSMRPLDLQALALGGLYQNNQFSAFYAASVAYGNTAMPNNIVRGMILFAQPMYATVALMAAPLTGSGWSTQQGASAFAMDWVAGVSWTGSAASVRGGYAGSRGFYTNVAENNVGLFASGLLGGRDTNGALLGFLKAGVDRFNWRKVSEGMGLTSVYLRDLPYGAEPAEGAVPEQSGLLSSVGRLRTGHFEQANLGKHVDLGASYTLAPVTRFYDASLAVHSANWVLPRKAGEQKQGEWGGFYARGGFVDLPGQATLGIEGGRVFTLRVEGGIGFGGDDAWGRGSIALLLNDPEVLALYPYAINATTFRYAINGEF